MMPPRMRGAVHISRDLSSLFPHFCHAAPAADRLPGPRITAVVDWSEHQLPEVTQ